MYMDSEERRKMDKLRAEAWERLNRSRAGLPPDVDRHGGKRLPLWARVVGFGLVAGLPLSGLALLAVSVYVAAHFIVKFW